MIDGPELREFLDYRLEKSKVLNNVTMTANYLHPVYRGKKLTQEQRQAVTNYVFDKLDASGLESLRQFSENEVSFANLNRKKTFWHFANQMGHAKLASFAMDYLKIPSSTAQLERLFSQWAYVHSKPRNRIPDKAAAKLANIYFTLRASDEIIDDDSDLEDESEDL